MKRFDFPLEKVRLWRHEQAELEEIRLQQLYSELTALDGERKQIEAERESSEGEIRARPGVQPQDLANLESYRKFMAAKLVLVARKRTASQQKVDSQRSKVIEARRQFELLERLKQKALAEWRAAADKEQEELAAELYLAKRQREAGGSGL